jgi:hypothetical protein
MRRLRRLLAVSVSETAVSATVLQAKRDQHEAGGRGQLEPILPGKSVPRHICYELIYNHAQ